MNCSYKTKRKSRGNDIILGIELGHEAPHKTKANIKSISIERRDRTEKVWKGEAEEVEKETS